MYSKRLLYTPVTRERTVTREKRKPLVQGRLVREASRGRQGPSHSQVPRCQSEVPPGDQPQCRKTLTSSPVPTCDNCSDNQDKVNRPTNSGNAESKTMDPTFSRLLDDSCSRGSESTGSGDTIIQKTGATKLKEMQKKPAQQSNSHPKYQLQKPNPDEINGNLRPTQKQNKISDDIGLIRQHTLTVAEGEVLECCRNCHTLNESKYREDPARRKRLNHKIHKQRNVSQKSKSTLVSSKGADYSQQRQETDVDEMYACYLQAVYLESCALRAYSQQEEQVMRELYQMALLVTEKQKHKEQMEDRVRCLRQDNKLHNTLHTKESSVATVILGLERLRKQYGTLSSALGSMRHRHGGNTHPNMDQFISQLNVALTKSEKLMRELSNICSDKRTNTETSFNHLHASNHTAECTECQPLLDAVSLLSVEDGSLLHTQDLHTSTS